MVTIDIKELIKFYDNKFYDDSSHVSAITGIAGEDLGAGLLKHYLESKNLSVEILDAKVTSGTKKGKRLDRWIKVSSPDKHDIIYQTEIKNWSSHSLGGQAINLDCNKNDLIARANVMHWNMWDDNLKTFRYPMVSKVLSKMKHNFDNNCEIIPLAVFWFPIYPPNSENVIGPFYEIECLNDEFQKVHVFSMSIYLRDLLENGTEKVIITSNNIQKRIEKFNKIFSIDF